MAPSKLPSSTSSAGWPQEKQDSLTHLSSILHLIHHRNKNQHRRSHWYRHFDIFRRHVNTLCSQITTLNHRPPTNLERARKRARDKDLQLQIRQRLDAWQDVYVAKWQHAFSQLVADGRFAVVGLALLGALAEVCEVTGITAVFEEVGEREVQKALRDFGEGWEASESDLPVVAHGEREEGGDHDDVGVVVERQLSPMAVGGDEAEAVATIDAPGVKSPEHPPQASKKTKPAPSSTSEQPNATAKRKRKPEISKPATKRTKKLGKSSIDDLFRGLV